MQAIEKAGLTDGFIHVTELGDYSVTYRVAGFLEEVKHLLSARSRLRVSLLDELYGADVEIASPTIMTQRPVTNGEKLIPPAQVPVDRSRSPSTGREDLVFDKAEEAANLESMRDDVKKITENLQAAKANKPLDKEVVEKLQAELDELKASIGELENLAAKSNAHPKK